MKNISRRLCYAKHDGTRTAGRVGISAIFLCLFAAAASADPVILFDDLYGPTASVAPIRPGYHGLAWIGLDVLDGVDFIFKPGGYQAGVVSPKNVVYPINGDIYTGQNGSVAGGLFDLLSAYTTATLNDGFEPPSPGLHRRDAGLFQQLRSECHYPRADPAANDFQVNWDGATLLDLTNWVHTNWLNPQFLVTAATTNTTLQFGFLDGLAYVGLDEVTVQPFPAPEFISQLVSAGSLDLTFATVPGFEYQVQYSLDLKTWNDLGPPRYATSIAMTASEPIGPDPHHFYRVIPLQPIHIF